MLDLGISLGMIGLVVTMLVAYGIRAYLHGRARNTRTDADGGSVFLNKATMEMVYWVVNPIIDFIASLRITPNMVTLFSLVPAAGAGVAIAFGWFGLASALATLSTICDILDGLLARRLGTGSEAGEVIDAAADRFGEFFMFGGLIYYYRGHDQVLFLVLAALVGGFMVSYTTAKAEAMGVPAPRGAMRRSERAAYLIIGCGFTPPAQALFAGSPSLALRDLPIILAITIVAVVGNISVLQRLSSIIALLRAREPAKLEPAPLEPFDPDAIATKPDAHVGSA
jgi:CDP-diacylglycerol--glycerol-3-phosphate 3-phosphatidyltransferase